MNRDAKGRFVSEVKYVWVMKSVNKDMSSYCDPSFIYPESGMVEAKDWQDTPKYGNGLHGFLWGEGTSTHLKNPSNYKWLLIRVNPQEGFVDLHGMCKFRKGEVVLTGNLRKISTEMQKHLPHDRIYKVIGSVITKGDASVIVGGAASILKGGNYSTVKGGHYSKVIGGDYSVVMGGVCSIATGGYNSIIILKYVDGNMLNMKSGTIGRNGLKRNTKYKLNENHEFVKA